MDGLTQHGRALLTYDYYQATLELHRDKVLKVPVEFLDEAWCFVNGFTDDYPEYEQDEEDCE